MNFRFCIFFLLLLKLSFARTALHTNTHTYIVRFLDSKVLAINRLTGEEIIISVGFRPLSMVIHRDYGYVVIGDSDCISVIDLQTHRVFTEISVGVYPMHMVIEGELGYVVNANSSNVTVIDLQTRSVAKTIAVGQSPRAMIAYDGFGYVVNGHSHTVTVLDLKTHKIIRTISVGKGPCDIARHGNFGYIVNEGSDTVTVLDLISFKVIETISVGEEPQSIRIHEGFGYVINFRSPYLSVIDLKNRKIVEQISVDLFVCSMQIHNSFGYVKSTYSKNVSVVDLRTFKVFQINVNSSERTVDCSDTHLYFGVNEKRSLGMCLFKSPYLGIEDFYEYDASEAFTQFELAALQKDYKQAKNYFNIAISYGHRKACAVAFYAFSNALWGATRDDFWEIEFMKGMDFAYYLRLSCEEVYPYDFKLKEL